MDIFRCRGDFKASRKSEAFQPVTPFTPADIPQMSGQELNFQNLLASVQKMRDELKSELAELNPALAEAIPETNPPV